jgi:hypothetical protein
MAAMEDRGRVALVSAALLYAAAEALVGLLLLLTAAGPGRIPPSWLDIIRSVAHTDVGAFAGRWLLHAVVGLQRSGKILVGCGLVVDGAVRSGLLLGVLRGARTATVLATLVFGAVAVAGLVVAGVNPPIGTFVTAALNVAVAAAIAVELRRLVSAPVRWGG